MPKISKEDAAYRIGVGPIGVGEDHVSPAGRRFAMLMILQGLVKTLFLECPSKHQPELDRVLRLARQSDEFRAGIKMIHGPMGRPNEIPLYYVAVSAIDRGIPIYLLDKQTQTMRYMGERDAHAARLFRQVTGTMVQRGRGVGCMILYGANHFIGGAALYGDNHHNLAQLLRLNYVLATGNPEVDGQ